MSSGGIRIPLLYMINIIQASTTTIGLPKGCRASGSLRPTFIASLVGFATARYLSLCYLLLLRTNNPKIIGTSEIPFEMRFPQEYGVSLHQV
jgi:hypothetical protein